MEKNKIILLNLLFGSLFLLLSIGYFEFRISGLSRTGSLASSSNLQNDTPSPISSSNPSDQKEEPEPAYEAPKDLSFSGTQVPGYASGEVVSISEEELTLKQLASIDLRYQIFKKDVSKVTDAIVTVSKDKPDQQSKVEEKDSDWANIKVGSKINIRLDENQKRIISIIILKAE